MDTEVELPFNSAMIKGNAPLKAGDCFMAEAFGLLHVFKATRVTGHMYSGRRVQDDYMVVRQAGFVSEPVYGCDDANLAARVATQLQNGTIDNLYVVVDGASWRTD